MLRKLLVGLAFLSVSAQAMEPVSVDDVRFANASLTVATATGETGYTPAELEAFGTYAVNTVTPWRETAAEFVGIRLRDVLDAHGLTDASAIRVVAENDYAVTIPNEVWTEHDLLIATRVDGRAHNRRARGPLQFVFNMSEDARTGAKAFESNWVWMAARIEPVQ
ncbi:MAG: molybdopterin-dependent oxidoreductase [Pseudomonadota bacterium]